MKNTPMNPQIEVSTESPMYRANKRLYEMFNHQVEELHLIQAERSKVIARRLNLLKASSNLSVIPIEDDEVLMGALNYLEHENRAKFTLGMLKDTSAIAKNDRELTPNGLEQDVMVIVKGDLLSKGFVPVEEN